MTKYFAEINDEKVVTRVLVCSNQQWLETRLGGTWVETSDPYTDEPQTVSYCGPGWGCDDTYPELFAPQWVQPTGAGDPEDGIIYPVGTRVFHNGRIWRSRVDNNVWEPGVAAWHDAPPGQIPTWFQPTGAADAYPAVDEETGEPTVVMHNDQAWLNTHGDGNVWEPGVFGWESVEDE